MEYEIDYKLIYNDAPDMCLSVLPGTGRVIECNQTTLDTLGYTREEFLSKHVVELYHPDDINKVKENLQSFTEKGEITHTEFRVLKKGGDYVEVSLKFTAVKGENGKILYSNAVWRDITEFKSIQRKLKEERDKSEELLLNILPLTIAQQLKEKGHTIPQKHEAISILFTDFVGFTKTVAEIPTITLIEELNDIFSRFDDIMLETGLEKIQTIGDAYLAACGVPNRVSDHAQRCIQAARLMLAFLEKRNTTHPIQWQMRVGIHSGPIVAGVVGKKKYSYDLFGDTINTASRCESSGEQGKINISGATHQLIKNDFSCTYRGEVFAKGKGKIDMYFVE